MERPPPFQHDQYFSARPPQQQQPPLNPEFSNQESAAHFFNSGTRGDMLPRNRTSRGLDLSMHGAFQRSELQNPGEIHGSGAGGSFWPRQDLYRHQQQFPPGDQRFESDRSAALQPPPYGSPFYHQQGDNASNPGGHRTMDLSKTVHPPFSEIPGPSGPDRISQGVGNAPQIEFSYRQQPPTVSGCHDSPWQPNNNYSTRMQTQFGDPRYNRPPQEDPSSYSNIGTFHSQSGPAIPNNSNYQRHHNPEASQYNFSESTLSAHEMHWHWKETSTTSRHQKYFVAQPDSEARQAQQDDQWVAKFLSKRNRKVSKVSCPKQSERTPLVSEARDAVYSAARLVSELARLCRVLKQNVENESLWSESYVKAVAVKKELQEKLKTLDDTVYIENVKKKLGRISKKRSRLQRKKQEQTLEKQEEEARAAEREAQIDRWRMKCVQQVEEKKREQELKAAADSVLSEVRKKQADSKRMMDILRSLEKLRKLRKEAAARKGKIWKEYTQKPQQTKPLSSRWLC
ncbi:capping protein inhibiting regulator of actin dynamics-like isoform X2 [Polyodon spathula]|uniref:capping protein inhibiting regulator of actin dynamics-like isoform X2 n=1 Tax=Polyodon spathula TaxID=7913 RepID=UPI001B7ED9C9|nr:capping protein inhibiting regulator of actin dynamics-like isoform X2 [Polyodon spathula]